MNSIKGRIDAVVIGASLGGIRALNEILPALPKNYPHPVIIVLHLPAGQPSMLAHIFAPKVNLEVKEVNEKEKIRGGVIYFAPADYHLLVEKDRTFSLSVEDPLHHSRPSIDILFESAADAYGTHLIGVILTGSNNDGALGLKAIKDAGGTTIVQNPSVAESPEMPNAAIEIAEPQLVLPLHDIARILAGVK